MNDILTTPTQSKHAAEEVEFAIKRTGNTLTRVKQSGAEDGGALAKSDGGEMNWARVDFGDN